MELIGNNYIRGRVLVRAIVSARSSKCLVENPLILLIKAFRTTSTAALPVLAGVLAADLEVKVAGGSTSHRRTNQGRNRELYSYFPDVSARLNSPWVESDYETSQLLIGHGYFRKRVYELRLNESNVCLCEHTDEDMHHVL
ncbi:Retrovirus-related Pol polyprotein from type-1 retrotransposable element R1 4 [Eumeta japonica]|uniref:Retrovirus-related Pol polyprotein from type-1 retrotransposable element R1 4 n=1 Tax=Eumeta variegata TaxID=151549 RepID=A0A4C1YIB2_EUMVA|nr:Retrovirus-related Pol polyprotein from type-1 retrotransposable element R1 4 [Eumeta japonica]